MLDLRVVNKYKKDLKLIYKQNKSKDKLRTVVQLLLNNKQLPEIYKDHALTGNYIGSRECHIEPDWLLIYRIDKRNNLLVLERTGSHSNLFESSLYIKQLTQTLQTFLEGV